MTPEERPASSSAAAVSEAGSSGQVRVVRCPRCGLLLPEYAGLSLYRCGGCSTPLVAKKQVLNRVSLEKPETEGFGSSLDAGSPSTNKRQGQVADNENRGSSDVYGIFVSGDPASSSRMVEGAEIAVVTTRVTDSSKPERSQVCESPGTPPNRENNGRREKAEDSAEFNVENARITADTGLNPEKEMLALQTEAVERSEAKRPQATDDPGASTEELPPSTDPGHSKGTEDKSSVSEMTGPSVGNPAFVNQSNGPRDIPRKAETGKHDVPISTIQYEDVGTLDKHLPNAEVPDDGFLGSDQRINIRMKQRKEKTLQVEAADGQTYVQRSLEYYGHSKEIRSREQKAPKVSSRKDRSSHRNEGPSNFHTSAIADASDRGEHSREDKEELLRMLDELRNQLSASHKVKDTPNGRHRMNKREDSTNPFRSPGRNGWFQERTSPDWPVAEEFPKVNRHNLNQNGFHLSLPAHEKTVDHEEPLRSHIHRRPPYEPSPQKPLLTSNAYDKGLFLSGSLPSHPHNAHLHQTSCLCTRCLSNFHHMPLPSALTVSKNQTGHKFAGGHGFSLVENAEVLDAGYSKSVRKRHPYVPSNPPNLRKGPVQRCRSLAGGAPFIICDHCHILLQLPCDILMNKIRCKVKCGSCFCLLVVKVDGIRLTVTTCTPSHLDPTSSNASRIVDSLPNQRQLQLVPTNSRPGDFSSTSDKTASANKKMFLSSTPFSVNNESMERQPTSDLTELKSREKLSLPPGASPAENPEVMCYRREMHRPLHDKEPLPHKSEENLKVSDPPLNKIVGYLGPNHAVRRNDTGSQNEHLDYSHKGSVIDSAVLVKDDPPNDEFSTLSMPGGASENMHYQRHLSEYSEYPQRSPKNAYVSESANHKFGHVTSSQVGYRTDTSNALVTMKYFSENRYSNGDFPQNSKHECIEDLPKINKGGRLSFTDLIKKSFKNVSHTTESVNYGRCKVVINGHPILDQLIRKAEQIAGQILPGSYWYDYRAGFWGVHGQPCLGIIPPNIEEFKYPMQKNCSGGNTSILINGRELHQTELNLLVERGLPTSRNKSYIVEISGRISDAESGEELESLGKLAPTVAQLGRGFGMCPLSLI